jgi:flagellar motor switch protein FliN/FliY
MATVEEEKAQAATVNDGSDLSGAAISDGDPSAKEPARDAPKSDGNGPPDNFEFILDIPLQVTVELGRTKMLVNELLKLGQGSVIELTKLAGESLEILVNHKAIARGEVVVVNDKYGIRLTEVISPMERLERLK